MGATSTHGIHWWARGIHPQRATVPRRDFVILRTRRVCSLPLFTRLCLRRHFVGTHQHPPSDTERLTIGDAVRRLYGEDALQFALRASRGH